MPTEFYYPISGATHDLPSGFDDAVLGAGTNKNSACRPTGGRTGPMVHDDGGSYIRFMDQVLEQALNADWPGPVSTVFSFTLGFRSAAEFVATARNCHFVNSSGTRSSSNIQSGSSINVYETTGPSDVSNATNFRPGGGSWQSSDFSETGIYLCPYMNASSGSWEYHTSVWGELGYTVPAGGFVFLLGLAGLAALPHVGRLTDFQAFRRYLDWREVYHPRHTKWNPGEDLQAWADVRGYRWPSYFLPA